MEGYFNISSSHDSFDDLDIEGKIADDFKRNENTFKNKDNLTLTENEEKRILDLKIELDDGTLAYVFSSRVTEYGTQWKCHVCDTTLLGPRDLVDHEKSKYHNLVMQASNHHRSQFSRIIFKEDTSLIAPGEPAPPGIETDAAFTTHIQATLDNFKSSPLIGLEYVVELDDEYEREPAYVCMLCDKKGDPRTVMAHLISYNHRLKYIERHFPITHNAINSLPKTVGAKRGLAEIVLRVSRAIEDRYGRLPPVSTDGRHFEENRFDLMISINKGKHFTESSDDTFVHLVDRELLTTMAVKTDDIPVPDGAPPPKPIAVSKIQEEEDDEVEFQGIFPKGNKGPINRQLRVRKFSVEAEEKQGNGESKPPNQPATENKKDDDLQSLSSISSITTTSSSPRTSRVNRRRSPLSRSRSRSRSLSRYRRKRRSRSLSRKRYRRTRSRSRSRRRSRSGSSRRRSRSPYDRNRRRRGRHLDSDDKKHGKDREDNLQAERAKWEKFREEVSVVEKQLLDELAFHEKNPEKHPQYPEEWKIFWNRRYKELQAMGRDPNKHDFKPEWITFWNKRMREMHEQAFMKKKEELREKLGLPEDEVKPHYNSRRKRMLREAVDAGMAGEVGGGGPPKQTRSRSPSPWEEGVMSFGNPRDRERERDRDRPRERERERERDRDRERDGRLGMGPGRGGGQGPGELRTISVLRTLTALEQQLGSLGPRINSVLSDAIAREKIRNGNADSLLADNDVVVLFETAKEKLKGQLFAGIVERNMVAAVKYAISSISELLHRAPMLLDMIPPPPQRRISPPPFRRVSPPPAPIMETHVLRTESVVPPPAPPTGDPVTVPGVGAVDKAAIAKEIATALIMQGKTDVSEAELEQLINAVVGMAQAQAQAQAGTQQPITTAQFVSSLQAAPAPAPTPAPPAFVPAPVAPVAVAPEPAVVMLAPAAAPEPAIVPTPVQNPPSTESLIVAGTPSQQTPTASQDAEVNALQLLQSAYDGDDSKVTAPKAAPPTAPATAPAFKVPGLVSDLNDAMMNKDADPDIVRPPVLSKSPVKTLNQLQTQERRRSTQENPLDGDTSAVEDLTETDLRLLLQSFKDLPLDEQHGLIRYLKRLEATDPARVEKLRKYVNLDSGAQAKPLQPKSLIPQEKLQALAKVGQSGRLSPFSSRQEASMNPQPDSIRPPVVPMKLDSDSDDDYTFEDVVKAASKTVSEQEEIRKAQAREEQLRREKTENERLAREKEEEERRMKEEKAKAEQALRELEEREREQQRQQRERERQEREAALKVGVANWNPNVNSNPKPIQSNLQSGDSVLSSLVSAIPPPLPPPTMASVPNMYGAGYGDMSAVPPYNGGAAYYQPQPNAYSQYPTSQQSGYYGAQHTNATNFYQQTAPPPMYTNQAYPTNPYAHPPPTFREPPPQQAPPQQGVYDDHGAQYRW